MLKLTLFIISNINLELLTEIHSSQPLLSSTKILSPFLAVEYCLIDIPRWIKISSRTNISPFILTQALTELLLLTEFLLATSLKDILPRMKKKPHYQKPIISKTEFKIYEIFIHLSLFIEE